ncbi:MAG: DUF2147 domain-containing protein [Inquilinus sp.]|uniref:DUF2147 domain-containing protein n=1 Tax=Inquilinus sp. TaxID=1932117 RepID=UPI003F2C1274
MWTLEDRVLVGECGSGHALSDDQYRRHARDRRRDPVRLRSLYQLGRAALLVAAITFLAIPCTPAWGAVPQGVWLIDEKAAVQIFDCDGLLCGRILWLQIPRDPQGQLGRDKNNPDPALRQRLLCGLTIIRGLQPADPDHWEGGSFYNPDDGKTYDVSAELTSADVLTARIYLGTPTLGETKTLVRVPHGTSEGWC